MKQKHVDVRIKQCLALAEASACVRRKFGALLLDPETNTVLMDAYNGGPRGGGRLCKGETCERDELSIPSSTQTERGCYHAEANVICNAARLGVRTNGAWLFVTGEPCLMCAKLIHHAGVSMVVCIKGGYAGGMSGPDHLQENGVDVAYVDGPQDERK